MTDDRNATGEAPHSVSLRGLSDDVRELLERVAQAERALEELEAAGVDGGGAPGRSSLLLRQARAALSHASRELGERVSRRTAQIEQEVERRRQAATELERALAASRRQRAFLEAVLHQMPSGVVIAEAPSGKPILGNPQVEKIWRQPFLPAQETGDYSGFRGFHPDGTRYRPEEWPLYRSVTTGETVAEESFVFQRGDNTRGVMTVSSAPVRNTEGQIEAAVAVFWDITERVEFEERLRESEERYRTLFESIDEGFCIIEVLFGEDGEARDYRFLQVNPAFERQTGIVNAVGRRMRDIAPQHEEHWFQIYGQVAGTGQPARFQNPAKQLGRYYDVYAFRVGRPEDRQVGILFNDIRERVEAEREREKLLEENLEQRQLLETVLDSIADSVWVHDAEGRITRMNSAAQGLWPYTPEEASQTARDRASAMRFVQEDGQPLPSETRPLQRALQGETVRSQVMGLMAGDGAVTWLAYSSAPVVTPGGECLGAVVTATDITEMYRTQEHLRESRAQAEQAAEEAERKAAELDAVIDAVTDGLMIYDQNAIPWRISAAVKELAGLSPGFFQRPLAERASVVQVTRPDGSPFPAEEVATARALRGETVRSQLVAVHRPDGSRLWLLTSAAPIVLGGEIAGAVAVFSDVTELRDARENAERRAAELKEAQRRLRQANEELMAQTETLVSQRDDLAWLTRDLELERARLATIIDSAPVGVLVADEEARLVLANRAASLIKGPPVAQPDGSLLYPATTVYYSDGRVCEPPERPLTRCVLRGEELRGEEMVFVDPEGCRRDVLVNSSPIRDELGEVMGAVACLQDISLIKETERERDRLEQLKADFLANVSHELRTPLTSMLGYVELVSSGAGGGISPEQRELLQVAYDSGLSLQALIEELLDISRLESDRFRLDLDAVSLAEVVQRCLARTSPQMEKKELQLECRLAPDLPRLWGDPQRLEQVLNNLLSNAVKFTPEKGSVSLAVDCQDGAIVLEVRDTGVGIHSEDLPHLFERFRRGRSSNAVPGTGLGLYLARSIVEAHGGTVEVESELGVGSTFRVRLPLSEGE